MAHVVHNRESEGQSRGFGTPNSRRMCTYKTPLRTLTPKSFSFCRYKNASHLHILKLLKMPSFQRAHSLNPITRLECALAEIGGRGVDIPACEAESLHLPNSLRVAYNPIFVFILLQTQFRPTPLSPSDYALPGGWGVPISNLCSFMRFRTDHCSFLFNRSARAPQFARVTIVSRSKSLPSRQPQETFQELHSESFLHSPLATRHFCKAATYRMV